MSEKNYSLEFDGYWRKPSVSGLPSGSGIYGVYAGIYNKDRGTISLNRLLYIGEAGNIQKRISGHEKWDTWSSKLRPGEELCFNAALISPQSDRERAEAAMIFQHKPPCNTEFVNSFPYGTTTIRTSGRNALLETYFTVYPSASPASFI